MASQQTMSGQSWVLTGQILGLPGMLSFTDSLKEILILLYFIIKKDICIIHVSERKQKPAQQ